LVYSVEYVESVSKDLSKLDKTIRLRIVDKIEKFLIKDPQGLGKPLTGVFKGFWRYRFDDYRVIYRIKHEEILIIIFRVGHRKNVYSKAV